MVIHVRASESISARDCLTNESFGLVLFRVTDVVFFAMDFAFFNVLPLSNQPIEVSLSPSALTKVLYFDNPSYGTALSNEWSDYDLLTRNIRLGCKRGVEALLDFGCRVEKPGKRGVALSMAVKSGWTKVAKKMLDLGARVSDDGWTENSPLRWAFVKKNLTGANELINAMLERHLLGTKADFVHEDGLSFFHIACARGELKFVEEFLEGGRVDVNAQVSTSAKRNGGYSALHFAVKFERNDVIELLIKHGANIYAQDVKGSTALHLAFYEKNFEAVEKLLSADREKKDVANNSGLTHFMIACTLANSLQAEQFLRKSRRQRGPQGPSTLVFGKVNPPRRTHIPAFSSYTPLHFAAIFGRLDAVRVLLTHGAFCCAVNGNWHTPAQAAREGGHLEVAWALEECCHENRGEFGVANDVGVESAAESGYDSMSSSNVSINSL